MCKLVCILTSDANVLCGSSDPAFLVCTGVWGLLSFIALILYLRWHGDHSSARDEPIAKLPPAEAPVLAEQDTLLAVGPLRSYNGGPEGSSLHAA
jgi:hypothetical protein